MVPLDRTGMWMWRGDQCDDGVPHNGRSGDGVHAAHSWLGVGGEGAARLLGNTYYAKHKLVNKADAGVCMCACLPRPGRCCCVVEGNIA